MSTDTEQLQKLGYTLLLASKITRSSDLDVPIVDIDYQRSETNESHNSDEYYRIGALLESCYIDAMNNGALEITEDEFNDTGSQIGMLYYLLVPFFIAEVTQNLKPRGKQSFSPTHRYEALKHSLSRWVEHVLRLLKLRIIDDTTATENWIKNMEEAKKLQNKDSWNEIYEINCDPEIKRNDKLLRLKLETSTKKECEDSFQEAGLAGDSLKITGPETTDFDKWLLRNDILERQHLKHVHALLRYTLLLSMNRISLTHQELPMLKMMIERQQRSPESIKMEEEAQKANTPLSKISSPPIYTILPGGKTIEGVIQKTDLINTTTGKAVERVVNRVGPTENGYYAGRVGRDQIKADVFKPFYTLPTVSLAECADWEMAMEVNDTFAPDSKARIDPETGASYTAKSAYSGNVEDIGTKTSEESDDDMKVLEKRAWDDWTDLNPKGSGNKQTNRA